MSGKQAYESLDNCHLFCVAVAMSYTLTSKYDAKSANLVCLGASPPFALATCGMSAWNVAYMQPVCSIRLAYLLLYNLLQFSGNTWIFANMTARFVFLGRGAQADTFYSVGVIMSVCQLLSMLELFHIADGIEKGRLLPRFVQVMERNLLLFVVFVSQEEFQSNPMVCVQFFMWNILQLLRYPHGLLCLVSTPSANTLWARYTLSIPVYILSVLTEGISIWQALPYFEDGMFSVQLQSPVQVFIYFPYVLMAYLPVLTAAASVTVWLLLKERKQQLDSWNKKLKRK